MQRYSEKSLSMWKVPSNHITATYFKNEKIELYSENSLGVEKTKL